MILIPKRKLGDIPTQQNLTIQETLRQVKGLNLDWANIKNVIIVDAQITNCSISKLTAGNLAVTGTLTTGGYLKSTNYVADTAGWQVDYLGNAEFNSVKVRGSIYTSSIVSDNTLTVSGTISAGAGKVTIDSTGVIIGTTGAGTAHLTIKDSGGTQRGTIFASTTQFNVFSWASELNLSSEQGVQIDAESGYGINFGGGWMDLPTSTFAGTPEAIERRFFYNTTSHVLQYHNGTSWKVIATVA